ncbi:hypothetical protein FISHEDRAFT_25805, partial [Fistulina hepatica ATCC 64428]
RSAVFTAARKGDADVVKKDIWHSGVDASGGEVLPGCEDLVAKAPKDPQETLLHIAVKSGNRDLVEWLHTHNADPEEKDAGGLTAFHYAVKLGHSEILSYFFENCPPDEEDYKGVYAFWGSCAPPAATIPSYTSFPSLLLFAVQSVEPQVVWMILEKRSAGLTSSDNISAVWSWVTSDEGKRVMM